MRVRLVAVLEHIGIEDTQEKVGWKMNECAAEEFTVFFFLNG